MTQQDRIETMCIQNRALLVAIADLLIAGFRDRPTEETQAAIKEVGRAIGEARPWRK